MRTTVDIPDIVYRSLKSKAASEGRSVKELILEGVMTTLTRGEPEQAKASLEWLLPNIEARNSGTLSLGKEGVYEYIPFP